MRAATIRMRYRCKGEAIGMGSAAGLRGRLSLVLRRMRGVELGKRVGGEIWRGRGRGWEKGGKWGSGEGFERALCLSCYFVGDDTPVFGLDARMDGVAIFLQGFLAEGQKSGIARDRNHRTGSGILSVCGDEAMYSIEVCIVLYGRILTKRSLSITPAAGDIHATTTSAAAIMAQDSL